MRRRRCLGKLSRSTEIIARNENMFTNKTYNWEPFSPSYKQTYSWTQGHSLYCPVPQLASWLPMSFFHYLTSWPWTRVICRAQLWDNFHQVWPSTTYPCLNYSVFDTDTLSRCDLHRWPVKLDSSWYTKRHVIKVCTKFEQNRAISGWIIDNIANICTRLVMLWPCPLTSWPWTFTALRVSCL